MKSNLYTREQFYLPDFAFEKGFEMTLTIILVAFLGFIFLGLYLDIQNDKTLWQALKNSQIPSFLFFFVIFFAGYVFMTHKKNKVEYSLKQALSNGQVVSVKITDTRPGSPSEMRGRTMSMDFGNADPVFNRVTFFDIKAELNGKEVILPHIPGDKAAELQVGQEVAVLHSEQAPEFGFMFRK